MSELQMGLLAIGLLVVVLVLAYNKLQESRHRRSADRAFGRMHEDVLMEGQADPGGTHGAGAVEPRFTEDALENSDPVVPPAVNPALPGWDDHSESGGASDSAAGNLPADSVDYILTLQGSNLFDCALLNADLESLQEKIGRTITSAGLHPESASWCSLSRLPSAKAVRVGLQMVSRQGGVKSSDVDNFNSALHAISRKFGAELSGGASQVLEAARDLDLFCSEVDVQIAISVRSESGGFSAVQIQAFASSRGFSLIEGRRYLLADSAGREICNMQCGEEIPFKPAHFGDIPLVSVTFGLDVPRCCGTVDALDGCLAFAREFAAEYGGRLVDDRGIALGDSGLESVRRGVEPIFAAMYARGIPAGSQLALRLFS